MLKICRPDGLTKRFRSLLALLSLSSVVIFSSTWAIDAEDGFTDPVLQQRYRNLIQEIRCLVCQNQTIADSDAVLASDLRREIRAMMADGNTNEQIIDFLVARYGDFVLYRPPFQANTVALWIAPLLLVIVGLIIFWRIVAARLTEPVDEEI